MTEPVKPHQHQESGKKQQVEEMFDSISKRYDFLNRFLSIGIDVYWRKRAIAKLKKDAPKELLDVATGTADLAIAAMKLHPHHIVGLDLSEGMLAIGKAKIARKGLTETISLVKGDSELLPFPDARFDAVTVAFGVRNFEHLEKGLSEIRRVLKPGGQCVILEFSKPRYFPVKQLYFFYFRFVLPFWGRWIAKHPTAYTYLPRSVEAFPEGEQFLAILQRCGYVATSAQTLSFGICSLYSARKSS